MIGRAGDSRTRLGKPSPPRISGGPPVNKGLNGELVFESEIPPSTGARHRVAPSPRPRVNIGPTVEKALWPPVSFRVALPPSSARTLRAKPPRQPLDALVLQKTRQLRPRSRWLSGPPLTYCIRIHRVLDPPPVRPGRGRLGARFTPPTRSRGHLFQVRIGADSPPPACERVPRPDEEPVSDRSAASLERITATPPSACRWSGTPLQRPAQGKPTSCPLACWDVRPSPD